MEGKVFVSYRRGDAAGSAGRIYEHFVRAYGRSRVFFDIDDIAVGQDFDRVLRETLNNSKAVIVVIGKNWSTDRLHDRTDYVRLEIETALDRSIDIIPILVDGATMPLAEQLPESLKLLSTRQAHEIRHSSFANDMSSLVLALTGRLGAPRTSDDEINEASWSNLIFGFTGRIGQQRFWLAYLLTTIFMIIVGVSIGFLTAEMDKTRQQVLVAIAMLPFWWPFTALILKRLRDFGQGWSLCLPYLGLGAVNTGALIVGAESASTALTICILIYVILVGSFKSLSGPRLT